MECAELGGIRYSYQIRVGYSTTDRTLKMTIPEILRCFQDAAIFEAENGSITMEYLNKHALAWLLGAWQIVILRRPSSNEVVNVATIPYAFKGFLGYRNFLMTSETGEELVKGASIWTLIDTQKGHPTKLTEEIIQGYPLSQKLEMDYAPRKIVLRGSAEQRAAFLVRQYQIDSNGHMNNAEYVKLAMELLPQQASDSTVQQIQQLRVEYKNPAYVGDKVVPIIYRQDNQIQVALNSTEGEIYAVVEFLL